MSLITTDLEFAITNLKAGKPVAIPTETVYGLAAMIDHPQAIEQVFAIKGRPLNHPLIVHVAEDYPLSDLVTEVPEYAKLLMEKFWPGPLTLVLNVQPNRIHPLVTGGQSTVAIRSPAHPLAQKLLKNLAKPVVAPSANPFGKVSPTTALHVAQAFEAEDLLVLDGGRCEVGIESTIIDATRAEDYKILRHGLIDEQVLSMLADKNNRTSDHQIRVPGALKSHYQPHKKLFYFENYAEALKFCNATEKEIYMIASKKPDTVSEAHFHPMTDNPQQVAFDLYDQLRKADASRADCILVELPPETNLWQGIRDRILKAGSAII